MLLPDESRAKMQRHDSFRRESENKSMRKLEVDDLIQKAQEFQRNSATTKEHTQVGIVSK